MYGERKKNISQASISCIDGLPRYALCVGRLPRCSEASPICGHRRQHSRCRASSWSPAAWRSPRCAAPPLPRRRRLVEPSLHHASSSLVGGDGAWPAPPPRSSAAVWWSSPCTAPPPRWLACRRRSGGVVRAPQLLLGVVAICFLEIE
jgi:hypothetical protein